MVEFELKYGSYDKLSGAELRIRNNLINDGLNDCKHLLGQQKTKKDYFFYEGSIAGFEECKSLLKLSDFEKRLEELHWEEIREISKSSLEDGLLREQLKIYNKKEKTDYNEVFKLKGIKTQVSFIYERLKLFRGLSQMKEEIKAKNEGTHNCYSTYY